MPYCDKCGNELPPEAKYCPKCGAPIPAEPVSVSKKESMTTLAAEGLHRATWGERFVAWLIDIAILNLAMILLSLIIYLQPFAFAGSQPWWAAFFNFTTSGVVFFLYWMLMDGFYGKSLGKMILHLRVARMDGSRINIGQAALESVGKAFVLPIDFLVGWGLYPKRRQRIFNYLSETIVIRE